MFAIARTIIRHKIAVVALLGIGAFFLMPEGEEEEATSSNPWSVQAAVPVAPAAEPGFVDTMMAEANAFLDEQGVNPISAADEQVGHFQKTAEAFEDAGK